MKPNGIVKGWETPIDDDSADAFVKELNEKYPNIRHWVRRVNPDGTLMKQFYVTWCVRKSSIIEACDEQDAYNIMARGDAPEGESAYVCDSFTAEEIKYGE